MALMERIAPPQVVEARLEVLTPAFLGGANPQRTAEWRGASVKGALRAWWRVACGARYGDPRALFREESRLFGTAGEKKEESGRSLLTVVCRGEPRVLAAGNPVPKGPPINRNNMQGVPYLAGQGLCRRGSFQRAALEAGQTLQVRFEMGGMPSDQTRMATALALFLKWGSLGSRQRHGFGAFHLEGVEGELEANSVEAVDWTKALKRDYSHAFGKDGSGLLAWRTEAKGNRWSDVLGKMGGHWYQIRHHFPLLDPQARNGQRTTERLLVGGYPMTAPDRNVPRGWGRYRHGSPLRLTLRRDAGNGGLYGVFYLLPHGWPRTLPRPLVHPEQTFQKLIDFMDRKFPGGRVGSIL